MHEAVEQSPLVARLCGRLADNNKTAGQYLDVVRIAPKSLGSALDVRVIGLRIAELAATSKDHLGGFGRELAAGIRGAGLNDDRPALDRPGDIQRTAHRQELALMVEHVQPV